MWILLWVFVSSPPSAAGTTEFSNEAACQAALVEFQKLDPIRFRGKCVSKADPTQN